MNITPTLSELPVGGAAVLNKPIRPETPQQKKLWESAKSLEAVFSGYLLDNLKSQLPGTSATPGAGVFADMFTSNIAQNLANSERLGLAKIIYQKTVAQADKSIVETNTKTGN